MADQRTGRIGRTKRLFSGDASEDLIIIQGPRILRLFDLHEHQIVHHQPILAQTPVMREEIINRYVTHLSRDLERLVGAGAWITLR